MNMPAEQYLNESVIQYQEPTIIERTSSNSKLSTSDTLKSMLQEEIHRLKELIRQQQSKIDQENQTHSHLTKQQEQQSRESKKLLDDIEQQLMNEEIEEQKVKALIQEITTIDYDNVESNLVKVFLLGKTTQIINYLKTKYQIDAAFIAIPYIAIIEKSDNYCLSVIGIQKHHDEFKLVLQGLQKLSSIMQSSKIDYKRELNKTVTPIYEIMFKQIEASHNWKSYVKSFRQLLQNIIQDFVKRFDDYITHQANNMRDQCITDANFQPSVQLHQQTHEFLVNNPLQPELEKLKYEAFEEFLKQNIFEQQVKFDKKPSTESVKTMNQLINKARKEFKTNTKYIGFGFDAFKQISKLLQRVFLYYRSFLLQLPLFESSEKLLDEIEQNHIITVSTSTRSGKFWMILRINH